MCLYIIGCLSFSFNVGSDSSNACPRLRQRDCHNPADVCTSRHLSGENKRPEGFHPNPPHTEASEATDAGILPDDLVAQQWNQYTGGIMPATHGHGIDIVIISIQLVIVIVTEFYICIALLQACSKSTQNDFRYAGCDLPGFGRV